jgi:glucosyl-3-phosphoglycerate synthase
MAPSDITDWFSRRLSTARDWPAADLARAKGATRVSVVLPARDEEATVGHIAGVIRRALMEEVPLVDELVVIDSNSTDGTAAAAAAAGAEVHRQDDILPEMPPLWGKGEALWKSLAVTTGDIVAFTDTDIRNYTPDFVTGLIGPLLADPDLVYVKGYYDRPLRDGTEVAPCDGGRVTELLARPLLNMCWPELAGVLQPLSGEYAGRRAALESVPFVCGYGVEFGLLVDLVERYGLDRIAQVDLGVREHSHQTTAELGRMAGQIIDTAWMRLHRRGLVLPDGPPATTLTQFTRSGPLPRPHVHDVGVTERPPMAEVAASRARSIPSRQGEA